MDLIRTLEATVEDIRQWYENEEILGIWKMWRDIPLEELKYKILDDGTVLYFLFSEKIGNWKIVIEEYKTKDWKIKRVIKLINISEEEQKKLAEVFKKLDKKGYKVMLSNSDTKFIKDLYKDYKKYTVTVGARRFINCIAEKRGEITELVIRNYK